jgi:hypothetical protein
MTTTYLANPTISVDAVSLTDQCKSVVVTEVGESLESTAFGSTARTYVKGLENNQVVATFLMAYGVGETYDTLEGVVGTQTTVVVAAGGKTFTVADTYLESLDLVNANLGELSEVQATFTGGTITKS